MYIEQSDSVYEYMTAAASANKLCLYRAQQCLSFANGMNAPEGLAVDGGNRIWMANSGNASVSELQLTFDSNGNPNYSVVNSVAFLHNSPNGGTMTTPYGIAVDGSGNVWVLNAGCTTTGCTPGALVLSELIGVATPVTTPMSVLNKNLTYAARPTK